MKDQFYAKQVGVFNWMDREGLKDASTLKAELPWSVFHLTALQPGEELPGSGLARRDAALRRFSVTYASSSDRESICCHVCDGVMNGQELVGLPGGRWRFFDHQVVPYACTNGHLGIVMELTGNAVATKRSKFDVIDFSVAEEAGYVGFDLHKMSKSRTRHFSCGRCNIALNALRFIVLENHEDEHAVLVWQYCYDCESVNAVGFARYTDLSPSRWLDRTDAWLSAIKE